MDGRCRRCSLAIAKSTAVAHEIPLATSDSFHRSISRASVRFEGAICFYAQCVLIHLRSQAMSTSKRARVSPSSFTSTPPSASRNTLLGQVSELFLLASHSQRQGLLRVLLEQVPTAGLEAVMAHAHQNGLSSPAIRSSRWSREVSLPMLGQVFQCLESKELVLAEGVCKRWQSVSRSGLGWQREISNSNWHPLLRDRYLKGRCTVVDFQSDRNATDATVAMLSGFKDIKAVYLMGKGITDKSVHQLKDFASLTQLSLLKTSITSDGISQLAPLCHLDYLQLFGRLGPSEELQLTSSAVDVIASLPLTRLRLFHCALSPDDLLRLFGALPNLRSLNFFSARPPSNLAVALKQLGQLRWLQLYYVDSGLLESITHQLPNLKRAEFFPAARDVDLGVMASCKQLTELELHHITEQQVQQLSAITRLQKLELVTHRAMPNSAFRNFHQLKALRSVQVRIVGEPRPVFELVNDELAGQKVKKHFDGLQRAS